MRLLHTSDWHLGRLFHQVYLTDDQAHLLDQFVAVAREAKPDAVLIAGDVYDRAVPPPAAVALLDDVLHRLAGELGLRVIVISGNHDGAERLGFGARLLAGRGLHIASRWEDALRPIVLRDEHGPVHVHALPYAEPAEAREDLARDDLHDHDAAMRARIERIRTQVPPGARSVLVAHAFAAGGESSESERPLSVGGTGAVDASAFEGFHYVALGHLHRPQHIERDRLVYPGSLYKYSFSEAAHVKGVNLVTMDAAGRCAVERVPLTPRRDVRVVTGSFDALLRGGGEGDAGGRNDYVQVILDDEGAILHAMNRLREVYPNVLTVARARDERPPDETVVLSGDHRKRAPLDLFTDFYRQASGDDLDDERRAAYVGIVDALPAGDDA